VACVSRVSLAGFAAVVVCLSLVAAVAKLPTTIRAADTSLRSDDYAWRAGELGPSFAWETSQELTNAAKTLPRNAVYTIVFGNDPPLQDIERTGIVPLFRYWLLPRRYTSRLHEAQWVITYHHSSETVGVPYAKEITLGPDANTFEVTR
jgi:hypothetical protein